MPHEPTGRRDFLKLVGLAGLSTTLGAPARAMAQAVKTMAPVADPAKGHGMVPSAPAAPTAAADTTSSAAPKEPSEDAKALASVIQRRYGQHLDADQMKGVTEELDNRIQAGQAMRKTKLANGEEPDFTFHV